MFQVAVNFLETKISITVFLTILGAEVMTALSRLPYLTSLNIFATPISQAELQILANFRVR